MKPNSSHLTRIRVTLVLLTLVFGLLPACSSWAEPGARAVFKAEGVDWIVGSWTGSNTAGQDVSVEYEWELDGCGLAIELSIGTIRYEGMIVREPTDGKLTEFGADNQGGITRASWRVEDGSLLSERVATSAEGQEFRLAVVSKKIDQDTVIATVHGLTEDGDVGKDVRDTVTLKRAEAADEDD